MAEGLPGDFSISKIKNEKIKKQLRRMETEKLRAQLPVLSVKEVRKFRLPYHEAIILDLEEAECGSSAEFVRQLILLQETSRNNAGPGTVTWLRPLLVNSRKDLDLLYKALSTAEKAHEENNFEKEWDEFINLAVYYAFGPDDWWWLGEQLLFQCIDMDYNEDTQKLQATSNYILGKYLMENAVKPDSAKICLEASRELSIGKSWHVRKILNNPNLQTIYIESCILLHTALTAEAQIVMKTDPVQAGEICILARKRAAEACDHKGEFMALLTRGKCLLALQDSAAAIGAFERALTLMIRKKDTEGICEARIQLALAYLSHGKNVQAIDCLQKLKTIAEENNMQYYVGQSYRYIGEYYLNQHLPHLATPMLMMAFFLFHNIGNLQLKEEARTLAAISAGEELFLVYIELVKGCDQTEEGHRNLMRLIEWCDERKIFWAPNVSTFSFDFSPTHINRKSVDHPIDMKGEEEIGNYEYTESVETTSDDVKIHFAE